MSITNLQNKPIVIGNPVEIEFAVNEIRKVLATMDWITHPYFIAQRFTRATGSNGRKFSYPETYAPTNNDKRGYHRLTPDNDYKGMFFFMVGTGNVAFEPNGENFITYPVSIIFSANLELINSAHLTAGLFTQELIRDARRLLTKTMVLHDFEYTIKTETRELRDVYREFVLEDLEQYNRAPMQCFRLELDILVEEDCVPLNFDRCQMLANQTSIQDQKCILPGVDFSDSAIFAVLTEEQKAQLIEKLNI